MYVGVSRFYTTFYRRTPTLKAELRLPWPVAIFYEFKFLMRRIKAKSIYNYYYLAEFAFNKKRLPFPFANSSLCNKPPFETGR